VAAALPLLVWGWLFLDVNRGDLFRRAAAWQHNVHQRIHLPVYMRRWMTCLVAAAAAGHGLDRLASPPALAAAFFVTAVVGVVIVVVAAVAWLFLHLRR
jgi:hypothetical protein